MVFIIGNDFDPWRVTTMSMKKLQPLHNYATKLITQCVDAVRRRLAVTGVYNNAITGQYGGRHAIPAFPERRRETQEREFLRVQIETGIAKSRPSQGQRIGHPF